MVAICLTIFTTNANSQCNCQTLTKDGSEVMQCPVKPIAADNSIQIGIGLGETSNTLYLSLSIRYRYTAQKVTDNLTITLANGKIVELKLLNSGLAYIGNSEICQSTFLIDENDKSLLKKSTIKTFAFYLEDQLRHLLPITLNKNILQSQLNCL